LKKAGHICGWDFDGCDATQIKFWVKSYTVPGFIMFFDRYSFNVYDGFEATATKLDNFFMR
jgi:hypothetical protein